MPRGKSRSPARSPEDIRALVEDFIKKENFEDHAIQLLRSKPPTVQQLVLSRGGFQGSRNPTAVLVTRIRNAEEGLRPLLGTEKASEEVERFLLIERGVEPHAAKKLRRASKIVQDTVLARGTLQGARDPTAILITRLREAEKQHPDGDPAPVGGLTVDALAGIATQNSEEYAAAAYYQYLLQVQAYQTAMIEQQAAAGAMSDPDLLAAAVPTDGSVNMDVLSSQLGLDMGEEKGSGQTVVNGKLSELASAADKASRNIPQPTGPPDWTNVGGKVLFCSNFSGRIPGVLPLGALQPGPIAMGAKPKPLMSPGVSSTQTDWAPG